MFLFPYLVAMAADEPTGRRLALVGIPYDAQSSFLTGAALAPGRIREVLHNGSSNYWTESGVDPISVLDIQRIIRHLTQRGIGVLITDHNVRETLGICGRAYILNDGQLMASGTPNEILSNQRVRDVYLGEGFSL